jgi:hypothetical protein
MTLFKRGEIPGKILGKIPGKIALAAREQKITLGEKSLLEKCATPALAGFRSTAATIAAIGTPQDRPAAWDIGRSQVPGHARRASTNCQYPSRMQFGLDYLSWPRGLCHARAHCIDRFGRQVSTSSGIDFSEPRPQLHSVLISSSEDIPPPGLGNVGCCP